MSISLVLPREDSHSTTFQRWWDMRGEWVEAPNQRRDGESGVQRIQRRDPSHGLLYSKRQVGHLYRSLRHPFGRPTALREYRALRAVERLGIRVPRVAYFAVCKTAGRWRALLVTEELQGFVSLDQWYRDGYDRACGEALQHQLLVQLARVLARLHRAGWQHGCLYPKHIFVRIDGAVPEVALLDLEKCRRRLSHRRASYKDLSQLRRHAEWLPPADWALFDAEYRQAWQAQNEEIDEF